MKFEKSCGVIVYRRNQEHIDLLLVKNRYGGHWSFPKGHVEGNETEVQTALREVREKTGLEVRLQSGFRQMVEYFQSRTSKSRWSTFWARPKAAGSKSRRRRSAGSSGPISAAPGAL